METLRKLFDKCLAKFRRFWLAFFRIKVIVITCTSRNRFGMVKNFGGTIDGESFFLTKEKLILRVRNYEARHYNVKIRTSNNAAIDIVQNKYFRTVEKNIMYDFSDLPTCD